MTTKLLAFVLGISLILCAKPIAAAGGAPAELAASLAALQQLKSQLDSAIATADAETAARIRQAEIAIDGAIASVKDAMDHGYGLFNNSRDQVMGNVAASLVQTQEAIQSTAAESLLGVNDSLAHVARVIAGIPGISIPTYVYAVTPLRFKAKATDRLLQLRGFFPDVSKTHPVRVWINDPGRQRSPLVLDQFVNNTQAVELPPSALDREEQFVNLDFELPVARMYGLYYTTIDQKARVYVERDAPFEFTVVSFVENPALWEVFKSSQSIVEHANSDRTANSQTITAADLFARLVNDNVKYEMSTAQFVAFEGAIDQGSNPCASGCTSSTGTWTWDAEKHTVTFSLNAPSCPTHMISPGFPQVPYQCGGGTHADFTGTPTFRVKKRGVQPLEVQGSSQVVSLRRKSVATPIPLPSGWTAVDITCRFRDGADRRESRARLTSGPAGIKSANEPIIWKAEMAGDAVVLTSR